MTLDYLQVLFALLIAWPRGYMLIYLVDRTKSMTFGFKFFVGWLVGLAGFLLDVFAANVFSGFALAPWVFYISAAMQIFGFGFLVFVFERKVPYPNFKKFIPFVKKHLESFKSWGRWEKIALVFLLLTLAIRISSSLWVITNIPTYDFDAWNNWNLRAKVIYEQSGLPLDKEDPFYLGGGIKSYPLHDSILKVWLATAVGQFEDRFINLTGLFYYLLLLAIFYFSLPQNMSRLIRILATYALSSLPLLVIHSQAAYSDILFSIYLFVAIISLFYFLAGAGLSFYYLSGLSFAFSIWAKNEGLVILFPVMVFASLVFVAMRKVKFRDLFLNWFFTVLTILPWLVFRFMYKLDFLSGDSSTFNFVFNYHFLPDVISTVFLRSHFNILWILVLAVAIFRFKDIWSSLSLRYLFIALMALLIIYNSIILFTDKALDLSAAARVNLQLAPLAVAFLAFSVQRIFGRMK